MRYVLTEYTEGHTHNTYHDHKGEAVADMMQRADLPATADQVKYKVWSYADATGYIQQTHAEAVREAAEQPPCVLCSQPTPNRYAAYCHECNAKR